MSTSDFPQTQSFLPDTGPLSWVMPEIREALGRSKTALFQAGGRVQEERATALQHARSYLHQAHGALQMVDIDGAGLLTGAAELALERFKDGSLECSVDHAQTVADLYQALVEYLDELLAGASAQPVRLFPYYRALQEMLGAPRIHPAELFFPDLSKAAPIQPMEHAPEPDYPAWRQRFEKALLAFLKSGAAQAQRSHAGALHDVIALVAQAQQTAPACTFWFAMQCFAELVAGGQLASGLYVKQLFGLINLQMRRLAQGSPELPEAMLRDALFFIAAAGAAPADAASSDAASSDAVPADVVPADAASADAVPADAASADATSFNAASTVAATTLRRAYRLDGMVAPDFEQKRYGRIDPQALLRAKQALAQSKAAWSRLAAVTDGAPGQDSDFMQAHARLVQEVESLKVAPLDTLLRQVGEVCKVCKVAAAAGAGERSAGLEMEVATALLFAEHGLERVQRLPADFAANAENIGARLQALLAGTALPAPASWQGELARRIEQDQTVAVLAAEMKSCLHQVEKVLDAFDADPLTLPALAGVDAPLQQLQGALAVLDQDHARRAALQVQAAVRGLAQSLAQAGSEPALDAKVLAGIAQNVGALGFFLDLLGQNAAAARERFAFDAAAGTFRAIPFEKIVAADPVPVLDQELVPATDLAAAATPGGADAAVEAELLDIFIGEAQEVLSFVGSTLAQGRADSASEENLTMLRRSFHTLKGSGRMVGLHQFADAGAAIERVLNVWLSDGRPATDALFALLERAAHDMGAWVADLAAGGASGRSCAALVAAALRVHDGAAFEMNDEVVGAVDELIELPRENLPASIPAPAPTLPTAKVIGFPLQPLPDLGRDDNRKRVGELDISLPLYNIYLAETDELLRLLLRDFGEWRHESQRPVSSEALQAAHTLGGTSGTVGFAALGELAQALEMAIEARVATAPVLSEAQHDLLERVVEQVRLMLQDFALGELAPRQPELVAQLQQLRSQLQRGAQAEAAGSAPPAAGPDLEQLFAATHAGIVASVPDASPASLAASVPDASPASLAANVPDAFATADAAGADAPQSVSGATAYADELDADLLPLFLEEGSELLPQIGQALRAWQLDPADSAQAQLLLRVLHTVKGSARMAGAMRLGQHAHEIESHIENMVHASSATAQAFEQLLAHYDHALLLFEQLQQPGQAPAEHSDAAKPGTALPGARTALVRVRADLLDRLVNQAGEVSISRSKLESDVGAMRAGLSDFADNLARLRRQLREVEMQAESQIASRMAISSTREFDPLEFDRFTRLQELTRMMAESVNDAASFHDNLTRSVDQASDDLVLQARLTRDLQRDLMQARMVPFASIAERLFRVARQSAKETDKRVNLDIRGSMVEIDRSVLERMAAPFEHLLRNAIVHGIETRARRGAAGKNETGELLVQISQQGNEVVIEFSDDGAGLDLERIRARARNSGLLGPDDALSDADAAELIFEPGFSTADSLTELAGRGVGMDIVRSEALALGGRVDTLSKPGEGARFTIRLPLTLAVTQVVLLACGGKTWALPSVLVEQVLQMKPAALLQAHADGVLQFQGQPVALRYLSSMLGEPDAQAPNQRSCPVILLKSGSTRLAVQVDEVLGNREVVVKNIGPQLERMAGIAGATVLGSGAIVLILNPIALAQHLEQHPGRGTDHADHADHAGAAAGAGAAPVPARVIMVVDDSLTVRRVTQRLLEREGYQVLLAKDGIDALEQLQAVTPALMLVDIEMPRMDGFDLTRNVRSDARTHAVPIIMITSRSADKHRNYALELGVNGYFGKPFQEPDLLAAIARLLQQAAPVQDNFLQ